MKEKRTTSYEVQIEEGEVAYVRLPRVKDGQKIAQTISLREILKDYNGYDVMLDMSDEGQLMGIEILVF